MGDGEKKSLTVLSIEKTELVCEKEFGHLLEPDSAARYGDPYAKYIDNALVRIDGMAAFAECLLEGQAACMTVARILSGWRNRLQAVRDCKENMRVFSRSEREIVTLFRQFCRDCADAAAREPDDGGEKKYSWKYQVNQKKEGALSLLGELFTIPELYEINDFYRIPLEEDGKKAGSPGGRAEKTFKITVELTEKEAKAYETFSQTEQKIRAALIEAEQDLNRQ